VIGVVVFDALLGSRQSDAFAIEQRRMLHPMVFAGMNAQELPPKPADAMPDSEEPHGLCPRCDRANSFTVRSHSPISFTSRMLHPGQNRAFDQRVAVLDCQGCAQGVAVIEEKFIGGVSVYAARTGHGSGVGGRVQWRGVHWWPTPGMTAPSPDVPVKIAGEVAEGTRCLAVQAPRAAAMMFRGAIAEIVQDCGSLAAMGRNTLLAQLEQMTDDGDLVPALSDWASHIRVLGNAGVHPSTLAQVSMEEAEGLLRLVNALLEYLYVMPAKIQRTRTARP
jgi:Domain of unknown function (DUF4145)